MIMMKEKKAPQSPKKVCLIEKAIISLGHALFHRLSSFDRKDFSAYSVDISGFWMHGIESQITRRSYSHSCRFLSFPQCVCVCFVMYVCSCCNFFSSPRLRAPLLLRYVNVHTYAHPLFLNIDANPD